MDIQAKIHEQVTTHSVVLYMKGTPKAPMCGFSELAVKILNDLNLQTFFSVNVLEDSAIRDGVKKYANWPTFPQLYVKGELVGGSDIMRDMFDTGELKTLLEDIIASGQ